MLSSHLASAAQEVKPVRPTPSHYHQDIGTKEKGAAFVTKAAPSSLFLCTGPAPAGAFRSATERSEALGAEIGTFLFLSREKKKCGA